jgi:hypothetical protein
MLLAFSTCAIPATFSLIAWLFTYFFLKETLPAPISISRLFNTTGMEEAYHDNDQNQDDDKVT